MPALTESKSEFLSSQLPGAGSIQPIEDELQLLPAAWEIFLLQLLRTKQISRTPLPAPILHLPQQHLTRGDIPIPYLYV